MAPIAPEALAHLGDLLGERASTSPSALARHGSDASYHPAVPPDVTVFPESTEEVVEIVRICSRHGTPVIPFGSGTSLEGHVAALRGGVSVDMGRMNRILAVRPEDLDATVEAGVTRRQLDERLRQDGVFFPVDPGADATLGGMAATRASGTTTVRYGTMRDNVLGLRVVLANGEVVRTSSRARKSSSGYDLTRLFVGSEGTLGVITELTLRVWGVPEAISSAVCSFSSVHDAVTCAIQTIQAGVPVARIELADEHQIDAVNRYAQLGYPTAPMLFFEFHGSEASVAEQAEKVRSIARRVGAESFSSALRPEDCDRLWQARHDAYHATRALRPGAEVLSTDVCVPLSCLAECITKTQEDIVRSSLLATIVGHVGDGNFHVLVVLDVSDPAEMAAARLFNERIVRRALEMDGTCTGEHGIGHGKKAFLAAEHGHGVEVMRSIKQALDPGNLFNPGKVGS